MEKINTDINVELEKCRLTFSRCADLDVTLRELAVYSQVLFRLSQVLMELLCFFFPQINGKHLDKIIGSSVDKVTKKSGDKLKLHVTRTILAMPKNCELKVGVMLSVYCTWPMN